MFIPFTLSDFFVWYYPALVPKQFSFLILKILKRNRFKQFCLDSPKRTIVNSADPDQTHKSAVFDQDLPYLLDIYNLKTPASVAQLDARPTGDQEVADSIPAEVGNILSRRLIMKYFLRSFSPFRWFKKGSCQFLAKEFAQYWLTA